MEKQKRYLALDVLRGLTVAGMITVNNPGSWSHIYAPLRHAKWHGATPTDLVFPFFLFVVGVSIFFSLSKYNDGLNRASVTKVLKRTAIIFGIGLFLNTFPQWKTDYSTFRIMGVLQRIAIAYCIGSLIVLSFKQRYIPYITGAILISYWGILSYFGGDSPYSLEQNATLAFDKAILGAEHMYSGFGIKFDPEGLLSTYGSIATVLIGYMIGSLIKRSKSSKISMKLIAFGASFIAIAQIWNIYFPINKALWTSSYVLHTAGIASIVLAILIYIIDIKGYKKWTKFFAVFGMNPMFIFALSGLWAKSIYHIKIVDGDSVVSTSSWIYNHIFIPIGGELNGSLLYALAHVTLFWLIGLVLFNRKIFIKV